MVEVNSVSRKRILVALAVIAIVAAVIVAVVRVVLRPSPGSGPAAPALSTSAASPGKSAPVVSAPLNGPPPGFPDLNGFTDVSADHTIDNHGIYPLATFTSPTGLQCAMWSSRGDTAAFCFGAVPGLDHPANQVYAGDYRAYFDQNTTPGADKLNGKPLASGQKVTLGAGGTLMGGDQITCGVHEAVVACLLIRAFRQNHGDDTAQRHGFVLDPQKSWTF